MVIDLLSGQNRLGAPNANTRGVVLGHVERCAPRDLFSRHYPSFASACRDVEEPGLAVVGTRFACGARIAW
jgi:hypothetical protein